MEAFYEFPHTGSLCNRFVTSQIRRLLWLFAFVFVFITPNQEQWPRWPTNLIIYLLGQTTTKHSTKTIGTPKEAPSFSSFLIIQTTRLLNYYHVCPSLWNPTLGRSRLTSSCYGNRTQEQACSRKFKAPDGSCTRKCKNPLERIDKDRLDLSTVVLSRPSFAPTMFFVLTPPFQRHRMCTITTLTRAG